MKKLAAIAVAFLLAVGLTAIVAPAEAAYPGSVPTYCHVHFKYWHVRRGHDNPVEFSVTTSGTGRPHGSVRVVASNRKHSYARSYSYYGGSRYHFFRKWMARGWYSVHMSFTPRSGSVYKRCSTSGHGFRVR